MIITYLIYCLQIKFTLFWLLSNIFQLLLKSGPSYIIQCLENQDASLLIFFQCLLWYFKMCTFSSFKFRNNILFLYILTFIIFVWKPICDIDFLEYSDWGPMEKGLSSSPLHDGISPAEEEYRNTVCLVLSSTLIELFCTQKISELMVKLTCYWQWYFFYNQKPPSTFNRGLAGEWSMQKSFHFSHFPH